MFTWQNYDFIHSYTSKQEGASKENVRPSVLLVTHVPFATYVINQHPVYLYLPQVTRKIIRKCISEEGVEHELASSEGDPQGTVSMTEGDGYSKVVKRTVIKSEGDHSEVCAVYHVCVLKMPIFLLVALHQLQFSAKH